MVTKKSNAAAERETALKARDSLPERDTYTAKQVATRCGTDAKTLRKFLRSSNSTAEAVGQGGRYEFDAEDLPLIQEEFAIWRKKAEARKSSPLVVTTPIPKKSTPKPAVNGHSKPKIDIQQSIDELHQRAKDKYDPDAEYEPGGTPDEDDEPTEEELMALEAGELDADE